MLTESGRKTTILLGEDEPEVRSYLAMALKCHGYSVELAENGNEVLQILKEDGHQISAVLLDILMPQRDGLETLREIRRFSSHLPIIMLSSASTPLNIVEAMKNGATDFLGKPVSHEELVSAIEKAIAVTSGPRAKPNGQPATGDAQSRVYLESPQLRGMGQFLRQIGSSEVPVLIQGETGSGKEVLARQLHAYSPRAHKPLLKLNCAALPSELVESELFGYERGAFTGAFQKKPGMFEMADGGALLLDEIGDMDFKLQAKLLQVLQDGEFRRIGGKEVVRVDVRIISATHRELDRAIAAGTFREDLYYRLNVITVRVPALRERREEILPLAEFFLNKYAQDGSIPPLPLALQKAMEEYSWPGNVRELENLMRKYLVVRDSRTLLQELSVRSAPRRACLPTTESAPILDQVSRAKEQAESDAILSALAATRWNRKQAAALLKIDYKALLYKMKKLSIEAKANGVSEAAAAAEFDVEPAPPKRYLQAAAGRP